MDIRIRCQRRDEEIPRVLELSPEEYFDPLNPGETLSVRLVPRLLDLPVHSDGSEEIIHATELGPLCWHTIRTLKQPGRTWAVMMNRLTVERPVHFVESRDLWELSVIEELKRW